MSIDLQRHSTTHILRNTTYRLMADQVERAQQLHDPMAATLRRTTTLVQISRASGDRQPTHIMNRQLRQPLIVDHLRQRHVTLADLFLQLARRATQLGRPAVHLSRAGITSSKPMRGRRRVHSRHHLSDQSPTQQRAGGKTTTASRYHAETCEWVRNTDCSALSRRSKDRCRSSSCDSST